MAAARATAEAAGAASTAAAGTGALAGAAGAGIAPDIRLKHDIALLGRLDDGLGYYRFVYNGGHTAYVGVMAQEVQTVMPEAVTRGADGICAFPTTCSDCRSRRTSSGYDRRAFAERETGRALTAVVERGRK